MSGEDPSRNPFIRFKQQVDAHVAATLQGVVGLPTVVSRTFNSRWSTDGDANASGVAQPSTTAADASSTWDEWRQAIEWTSFALDSPYSPRNLRTLPGPVPQDVPETVNKDAFTFEDAFEDLLATSCGRPMMDLGTRYEMRKMLRQMFPDGEPVFFWLQRLRSQSLLDGYFPRAQVSRLRHDYKTTQAEEQAANQVDDSWARGWPPSDPLPGVSASTSLPPVGSTKDEMAGGRARPPSLFDEMDRLFKVANQVLGDADRDLPPRRPEQVRDGSGRYEDGPETFDDLYNTITSAFSESGRSLATLFKVISDATYEAHGGVSSRRSAQTPDDGAGKLKSVEATESYVDEYGYLHTKRTVRTVNERGDEVGSETEYSVRPARQEELENKGQVITQDRAGAEKQVPAGEDGQKPGWFWK